ncbi:hypothetical protein BU25DRAFT_424252 [Macroventuria anomochaeta]|uniref:Uncharacterized protein n=1 Tax=Macroventuria anomochaeta TaxID=301207 RepID=A0ACB6RQY8_9PLEO|nr:uncharacterized protein BU25DRAFT_424252 [Macroventuria anomochaeta]KAF2624148.1 hypothetical protein BU25DRAFT_424252 [Macroventuria anomochaeta]
MDKKKLVLTNEEVEEKIKNKPHQHHHKLRSLLISTKHGQRPIIQDVVTAVNTRTSRHTYEALMPMDYEYTTTSTVCVPPQSSSPLITRQLSLDERITLGLSQWRPTNGHATIEQLKADIEVPKRAYKREIEDKKASQGELEKCKRVLGTTVVCNIHAVLLFVAYVGLKGIREARKGHL